MLWKRDLSLKNSLGILGSWKPQEQMDPQSRINGHEELMGTKKKDFGLGRKSMAFSKEGVLTLFPSLNGHSGEVLTMIKDDN